MQALHRLCSACQASVRCAPDYITKAMSPHRDVSERRTVCDKIYIYISLFFHELVLLLNHCQDTTKENVNYQHQPKEKKTLRCRTCDPCARICNSPTNGHLILRS